MSNRDPRKYISTPDAARLFNLDRTYAAKLAREAKARGNPYPIKRGKSWEAPESEWAKIFQPTTKKIRKPRPISPDSKDQKESIQAPDQGISCAKAALKYGISPSWATKLARRAKKKGYVWPKKAGRHWVAPFDQWIEIFEDESLRAWKKTKNKQKK